MKKYILETDRMALRQFESSDFDFLFDLNSEPLVMTYINGGKPSTKAEVQRNLELTINFYSQSEHLGLWVAEDKVTREFLGWFSLKPLRGTPEIEIGYRLKKKHWGKGLATEGAGAMVAVAHLKDEVLFSHEDGPFATKSQIWRWSLKTRHLTQVLDGLPQWLEGKVDTNFLATKADQCAVLDRGGNLWFSKSGSKNWKRIATQVSANSAGLIII